MLMKAARMETMEPEVVYKIIDKEMTKLKYSSFGKVKISKRSKEQKRLDDLVREKIKLGKTNDLTDVNL